MAPTLRRSAAKADADTDPAPDALYDPLAVAAVDDAVASAPHAAPALRQPKRLPVVVQFPLVATLSFAMASLGYSLLGEMTKGELASVSRSLDTWGEVGVLAGWRLLELATGWFGNLDSLDIAMMDLLSHGPTMYLLTTFYTLSPATAVSALVVDVISVAVPFYLLRPLSAVHKPGVKLHNRELIDIPMQIYTTALSTTIYTVILILSLRMVLPSILVVHFAGLPTLEPAYSASYATTLPVTLAFGAAASLFIFAPFATTGKVKEDEKLGEFDPVSASLGETVWWNTWGYTAKTKVVIRRTVIAAVVTGINTYLATTMTIYGINRVGAAAYSAVWVFAAVCAGIGLGLVGGD
jgi:hypothetical protein